MALLAYPGVQTLDVAGPFEVFSAAGVAARRMGVRQHAPYRVELLAERAGPLRSWSGFGLAADRAYDSVHGRIDTLLVAGGDEDAVRAAAAAPGLLGFLQREAKRTRRIGSVCTGAFLLAEAGLLDGRRATTHWGASARLARMYPAIDVAADAIWVRDGSVYTSAGVTAGIDLALALVEEDLGREVALAVARQLVVFLKRPGGQSQFSAELEAQVRASGPLERLPEWLRENLRADLSVETLAARVGMSPRNFARVFRQQFHTTPARFVERTRVERARRHLEEGRLTLDEVALACGFRSSEQMRRSFRRKLGVVPQAYRERFERDRAIEA